MDFRKIEAGFPRKPVRAMGQAWPSREAVKTETGTTDQQCGPPQL